MWKSLKTRLECWDFRIFLMWEMCEILPKGKVGEYSTSFPVEFP